MLEGVVWRAERQSRAQRIDSRNRAQPQEIILASRCKTRWLGTRPSPPAPPTDRRSAFARCEGHVPVAVCERAGCTAENACGRPFSVGRPRRKRKWVVGWPRRPRPGDGSCLRTPVPPRHMRCRNVVSTRRRVPVPPTRSRLRGAGLRVRFSSHAYRGAVVFLLHVQYRSRSPDRAPSSAHPSSPRSPEGPAPPGPLRVPRQRSQSDGAARHQPPG